jgi:subtilisin
MVDVTGRRVKGTRARRTALRLSRLPIGVVALLIMTTAPASAATGIAATAAAQDTRVKAIVVFDSKPNNASARAVEQAGGTVRKTLGLVNGLAVDLPRGQLKALARAPHVKSVELDAKLTTFEPQAAPLPTGDLEYDNAWGVTRIGSKVAHDAGVRGQGVKVAIIDTGIDYIHDDPDDIPYVVDPEFNSNYRGGYDFVNNDADPYDDNGHGTHVAGILAAEKNGYLVVGVAPQVDLYALKILAADGTGDESNLILALQWAVDHDIDVVNMSLGTHDVVPALQIAVQNAAAAGVLLVAASGNTVTFQEILYGCPVAYPGAYPQVLSTTFTNVDDALTGYSCTGPQVDFASPGDNIFSPVPVGSCMLCSDLGYAAESGTSMASPHLAGAVALLLSAGITDQGTPGLFDDVQGRLCATTTVGAGVAGLFGGITPIPTTDPRYPQYFGCGVVNAGAAVTGLTPPPPPTNRPPIAADDGATTAEDTAVSISIKSNDSDPDGDPISVSSVGTPTTGTAALDPSGNAILYTPPPNANGTASFVYSLSDGRGGSDTATVTVTITAVNDAPVAVNDSATTAQGTSVTVSVLTNDTDIDSSTLSVASASDPPHGTVVVNGNGTITYTPDAGYSGSDAFGYAATDGSATSNVATVSITVTASPPPPPNLFHVGDLDGSTSIAGKTWTAKVTIRIENASNAPLSGAVVTGSWSNGSSGSASCTTASNGTCSISKAKLARTTVASVTFTITNVTRSGGTYTPSANHDPDVPVDSNGTTIVILRPS